jgi:hypothetical protein
MLFAHNKPIHERIRELPSGEKLISSRVTLVGGKKRTVSDPSSDSPKGSPIRDIIKPDPSSSSRGVSELAPPSPSLAMYMKKSMSLRSLSMPAADSNLPEKEVPRNEPLKSEPETSEIVSFEPQTPSPKAAQPPHSQVSVPQEHLTSREGLLEVKPELKAEFAIEIPTPQVNEAKAKETLRVIDNDPKVIAMDPITESKEEEETGPPFPPPLVSRLSIGSTIYQPKKKTLKAVGTAAVAAHRLKARQSLQRSKSIPIDSQEESGAESSRRHSVSADHSPLVQQSPDKAKTLQSKVKVEKVTVYASDRNGEKQEKENPHQDDDSSTSTVLHVVPSRRSGGRVSRAAKKSQRNSEVITDEVGGGELDDEITEVYGSLQSQRPRDRVASILKPTVGDTTRVSLAGTAHSVSEDPGVSKGKEGKGLLLPRHSSRALLKENKKDQDWVKDYDVSATSLSPPLRVVPFPLSLPPHAVAATAIEYRTGRSYCR